MDKLAQEDKQVNLNLQYIVHCYVVERITTAVIPMSTSPTVLPMSTSATMTLH